VRRLYVEDKGSKFWIELKKVEPAKDYFQGNGKFANRAAFPLPYLCWT